jgi:hypothetical protein
MELLLGYDGTCTQLRWSGTSLSVYGAKAIDPTDLSEAVRAVPALSFSLCHPDLQGEVPSYRRISSIVSDEYNNDKNNHNNNDANYNDYHNGSIFLVNGWDINIYLFGTYHNDYYLFGTYHEL